MSWMTTSEHAGRRQCLSAGVDGVNHVALVSQNKSERIDGILIVINDEDSKRVVVLASVMPARFLRTHSADGFHVASRRTNPSSGHLRNPPQDVAIQLHVAVGRLEGA